MNIQNWKIFDKAGSQLNWTPDALLPLTFQSPTGQGAEGYLVTDPSGHAISAEITNGGYLYDDIGQTTVSYTYSLESTSNLLTASDASILTEPISVFNPVETSTYRISGLSLDLSTNFVYPSVTFASAIFLKPVSKGLIETENLFIFEQTGPNSYRRPYDASNYVLVMEFLGDDEEIQFFDVNEDTAEVSWAPAIVFDTSILSSNTPIQVNIGFKADVEGVFERILRIYHLIDNTLYTLADIVVSAESIGEDERFRTLLTNFGLPDPKDMKDVFKETDINEDLPDWNVLNYKSKHMILEHDKIMPFVGTYKGLINAVKWLGYDDIYFREWFKNVKENKKLSFIVPFDAKDRTQTILMFSPEERKTFKKLNQLTMVYCITRDTGQVDDWGTPMTENCYSYNLKELFIKLMGLKKWLELNIIGVNCRITDISGEGVYYERFQNLVYSLGNIGFDYSVEQSLTPYGVDHDSELVKGDANIKLSFLEMTNQTAAKMPYTLKQLISYAWNPNDPNTYYSINDPSYLADPSSFLLVGPTFKYPFVNISDIMWKLSVEKDFSGVLGNNVVTNPLFIYENEIKYYNTFDTSSLFYCASTKLTLMLEKAYLRDPSLSDEWQHSIAYSIYPDPLKNYDYVMESSTGALTYFNGYATFFPESNGVLQYAVDSNFKVPLLSFKNFKYTDSNNDVSSMGNHEYYLDILDGKIFMDTGMVPNASDNLQLYLNFNYDTSLSEQKITVNAVYYSPRMSLFQLDPSAYYWADPSGRTGGSDPNVYFHDNSVYTMYVNHIGDYNIELFAWDQYNTMFYNPAREKYPVWIKTPTLYTLIDNCCNTFCSSTYISKEDIGTLVSRQPFPIYDRYIPLQGLSIETDVNGRVYVNVPSITYFQDVPEPNSLNKFFNLTERVTTVSGANISIDPDFQRFYTGDNIRLVKFDKGKYSLIKEVSANIILATPSGIPHQTMSANLNIACPFIIEASTDVYVINDTYRSVSNVNNTGSNFTCNIDVSAFEIGQLVGIIIQNSSMIGYEWGSTYKVLNINGSTGNTYTFDNPIPQFVVGSSNYTLKAKHAFSAYSDFTILTDTASEVANNFNIYLKNSFCQEYFLDDTFTLVNILFDQDIVNQQWYNASDNLINDTFYYHSKPINVDISTLVILKSEYDNVLNNLSWISNSYDTFNSSLGLDISTAICNSVTWQSAKTRAFSLRKGDIVTIKANANIVGANPYVLLSDAPGLSGQVSQIPPIQFLYNGDNTISLIAKRDSAAAKLVIESYGVTNYSASISAEVRNYYLLNQKNIWTVINHDSSLILFKVYNDIVPYIFDASGVYDVECVSYDSYGNAITKKYEGLIKVS